MNLESGKDINSKVVKYMKQYDLDVLLGPSDIIPFLETLYFTCQISNITFNINTPA